MENIEYCVLTDEKDIIEFEKGIYNAFKRTSPNGWLMTNYEIIDNCRLKSKNIPYSDMKIYAAINDSGVLAVLNMNYNNKNQSIKLLIKKTLYFYLFKLLEATIKMNKKLFIVIFILLIYRA